ncbi:hypothetical protein CDAR_233291 [Caerostris darwini]|uniref:Uncharacterized protein n=1 Tax=Caerostris darwini TaxID=1538125 RepID=A0AAV4V4U8_9ARAC|nr:hypothetical protein CDAR_233291 [Caerostris darwini]
MKRMRKIDSYFFSAPRHESKVRERGWSLRPCDEWLADRCQWGIDFLLLKHPSDCGRDPLPLPRFVFTLCALTVGAPSNRRFVTNGISHLGNLLS